MLYFPITMQSNTPIEKLLIPEQWRDTFEIKKITEKKTEWILILEERNECVPTGSDVILRGFRNPVEVIDFPFHGKPMYIKFYRRRYQVGEGEVLSNTYNLHPKGMKATKEFGDFLKGLSRQERREFFLAFPDLRHIREEDFSLVSRCAQWFHRTRSPKDPS
jgi:hypothetical protein